MTTSTPVAGWYPDPMLAGTVRYYDGTAWTGHVAPAPQAFPEPGPGVSIVPGGLVQAPPAQDGTGMRPDDPLHWMAPIGRTWQSVLAGYVGIVALVFWVLGPVSVAVGLWALRATDLANGRGRGRAVFAIVVGAAASVGALIAWRALQP